jgi:metal-dependent amidase/aminoacylase/carboxypeptidase family protein
LRLAEEFYGKDNAGQGVLPVRASEDFGYFCRERPGAFFFLSSGKTEKSPMVHSNNYDFNDGLIDSTGRFWLTLVRDRFELS